MGNGKRVFVVAAATSLLTLGVGVSGASAAPGGNGNGTCVGTIASTLNQVGKDRTIDVPGLGGVVISTIARAGYLKLVQDFCHR